MRNILKIFFKTRGGNAFLLTGCLLLGTLAESIGLASMLPLLSMVTGSSSNSPVQAMLHDAFAAIANPGDGVIDIAGIRQAVEADQGVGVVTRVEFDVFTVGCGHVRCR